MKTLGRLAMAAALIVPMGIATAQTAGASTSVVCANASGGLKFNPGLLFTNKRTQTLSTTGTQLTNCTGTGIVGSTSGVLSLSVQTPAPVTCRSIINKIDKGAGKIVWGPGSNFGQTTTLKFGIKITDATHATIFGTVTSTYLFGQPFSGHVSFASIATAPTGNCQNSTAIKFRNITNVGNFTF